MSKICFLINSLSDGGAEKVVKLLVEKLYLENIKVELICLENNNNIYILDNNISITYLNSNKGSYSLYKLFSFLILPYKLSKIIKNKNIYLIQSHLFKASYINVLSKFFGAKHRIQVVNHSVISRFFKEGISGKINLILIKYLYKYVDKIISVSNFVQNDMQKIYNFSNNMEVIYNPFDLNRIRKLSDDSIHDFVFMKNKKYLISVGRLIPLKRHQDMLFILSKLSEDIELILLGEGPEKKNLQCLSKDLNINNRVHFLGWKINPYKYIKKSDILISTSQTESFSNVIIEGMACNTVVVSSKCGGPEEIIGKKNGVIVDIGDVDSYVKVVRKLLIDKDYYNKFILNSNSFIERFDINNIIRKYKKVLLDE